MKQQLLIAISFLTLSTAAQAVTLKCQTNGDEGYTPRVSLVGSVSDEFAQGEEAGLTEITDVVVTVAGETTVLGTLTADQKYKPRMENRVRFNTKDLAASDETFDGIVHGFIFPQAISDETFAAKVISSDDSYHDGIWSYYSMECQISY